jgi:hypothetical protein
MHETAEAQNFETNVISLKYKSYYLDELLAGQQKVRDEDGHGQGSRHRRHVARHTSA